MTLAELAVAALLTLRPGDHRMVVFGQEIAEVVYQYESIADWLGTPPLRISQRDAVLVLVAIAYHESRLAPEVADCRVVGSDLPSITAFQLIGPLAFGEYSRSELCASPKKAAERALAVWVHHSRCGIEGAFRGYASGDCRKRSAAAERQMRIWRWLKWKTSTMNVTTTRTE